MPIYEMRETSDKNNSFTCLMCGSKFSTQQALDRHKQDDHNDPSSPPRHYR
jgi:hypothetical protein